jgi:hypothetical protein
VAERADGGPAEAVVPALDGQRVDIHVPMESKARGGRKEIIQPPEAFTSADVGPRSPLAVALARAYHWQRVLDPGEVKSPDDLATPIGVGRSYAGRLIRPASLSPEIVESVFTGTEPNQFSLAVLRSDIPLQWEQQLALLGFRD